MLNSLKKFDSKLCEQRRHKKTLKFLKASLNKNSKIFDLGIPNKLSSLLKENTYQVDNTKGEDLDTSTLKSNLKSYDAITAFEILEHLINPYNILNQIKCKKLFATVPLKLWFNKSYRNMSDERDQHYHEFEDWQFDWLLKKSGWKIIRKEKWRNPSIMPGFRPILRSFYKRYYAIEAEKIN